MIIRRGAASAATMLFAVALLATLLAACDSTAGSSGGSGSPSSRTQPPTSRPPSSSSPPSTTPPPPPSTSAPPSAAQVALAGMDEAQRVGQLFMVGGSTTGVDQATSDAITNYHAGSVIMMGSAQVTPPGVAAVSAQLQQLAGGGPGLFVATDQEGGQVARLQGPGFSPMPSALQQGQLPPATLQAVARTWGSQMAAAGVNVDLAPVMGTVPSPQFAPNNPPIGALDREFGFDPATVAAHGVAFLSGLAQAGVDATVKHFPGLGRVTGNTDTTSGVTDDTTTRHDAYLAPFAAGVKAGTPFVMVSTAIYAKIDPGVPGAFSKTVVTGMLRRDLGFTGVVISDDLGGAKQVAAYPAGQRAVEFVEAGGDMILTVDATQIAPMSAALLQRANSDPAFRAEVDAAALRVLTAKQARGLLS